MEATPGPSRPSAIILPFPVRRRPAEPTLAASLRRLQAALQEETAALVAWRSALSDLHVALTGAARDGRRTGA